MMNVPARPARSGILAQVLTLPGGTFLAQVIALVAQIGITRLYTDTDLDYLGIFTSAAALGVAVVGTRFDPSTVLPAPGDETPAWFLAGLASYCMLIVSALAILIAAAA